MKTQITAKCNYCNKNAYKTINWEGLTGYMICYECLKLKDEGKLETFFIKNKLNN